MVCCCMGRVTRIVRSAQLHIIYAYACMRKLTASLEARGGNNKHASSLGVERGIFEVCGKVLKDIVCVLTTLGHLCARTQTEHESTKAYVAITGSWQYLQRKLVRVLKVLQRSSTQLIAVGPDNDVGEKLATTSHGSTAVTLWITDEP